MTSKGIVHVVDDEESFRRSLIFLLEDAGYDVAEWRDGAHFLDQLHAVRHGCVLLDVRMPGVDGPTVQRMIVDRQLDLPVIVLTGHGDVSMAVAAMKAGAVDFLEKPFHRTALLAAVDAALSRLNGGDGLDPASGEAARRLSSLSAREQEVLHHLARGLSNKETALAMNISPRTVEVHRANLMAKLAVRRLSAALRVVFAAEAQKTRPQPPP